MAKQKRSRPAEAGQSKAETRIETKESQGPWTRRLAFIGLLLGVLAALVGFFTPAGSWISQFWEKMPAQLADKYDKTSPMTTKCVDDNEEWKTFRHTQPGSPVDPATTMRVNGSESCQTAWVFVANSLDGTRVDKSIERLEGNGLAGVHRSTPEDLTLDPLVDVDGKETIGDNGKSYTDQVFASECVWVSLKLSDIATGDVLWEVPRQEVCKP